MRFDVTFRNTQGSEALIERSTRKFEKVYKYLREPVEAHLALIVEKHRHRAELTVTSGRDTLKVQEETDDMYASIDRVMHKVERIARRHKERVADRWAALPEQDGFSLSDSMQELQDGNELDDFEAEDADTEMIQR